MPRSGALKLKDYPTDIVRLACSRCPRKGQYRKAALMVRFGKDITLADLRHEIAKCERQGKRGAACGVYYWIYDRSISASNIEFKTAPENDSLLR